MNTMTRDTLQDQLANPHLADSYTAATESAASANSSVFGIENILVSLASLEEAQKVFACAHWFAEQAGSKISVLFVGGAHGPAPDPEELREEITKMAGLRSEELRAVLVCRQAPQAAHVAIAARAEKADLIVIPVDFFEGTSRFLQGDPMRRLLRIAPCPFLIVGNSQPDTAK